MKKILVLIWIGFGIISCGGSSGENKKDDPKPTTTLKGKISKSWIAQSVTEDNTLVYTRGGNGNIKNGYSSYRLILEISGNVKLTEVNGDQINGTWQLLAGDTRLALQNLTPQPSESGGVLEFTINSADEKKMNLTATKINYKTGGTINKYELVPL